MESNKITDKIKNDFPLLSRKINSKNLVYLDNAATTQKPSSVINAISIFYKKKNANIHRGLYKLSQEASLEYDAARKTIAKFINASENEIIFTKNTTESINLLSYTLSSIINENKKEIVLTELEHHSNLVPWQQLAKREGFVLKFIKIKEDFSLDYDSALNTINDKTGIVSISYRSNVIGITNDVKKIIDISHKNGALVIIDAAQVIAHRKIDVQNLGCDFLAFSGHKIFGPTGIGILYGKKELLEKMTPFNFGGDMVKSVEYTTASWKEPPTRFEAGTQNLAGAIGLMEAIKYLEKIGLNNIYEREKELYEYTIEKLKKIDRIEIYNEKGEGIISFNLKNTHAHDVASLMDDYAICIRGGHHCAMPLMNKLGVPGTCRVSLSFYNTFEDIDSFIDALKKVEAVLLKNGRHII